MLKGRSAKSARIKRSQALTQVRRSSNDDDDARECLSPETGES